jgi:6-phosphogluconolactonase
MGRDGFKLLLALAFGFVFFTSSLRAQFAYVANTLDGTISGYSVSANGALTPVPGSPFAAVNGPSSLTMDPVGKFLYVLPIGSAALLEYSIGSDGALTPVSGSPFEQESRPASIAVTPNGKFLYVATIHLGVFACRINANGSLNPVPGSPFSAGFAPISIIVEPKGQYVYVLNVGDSTVSGYHIESDGALVPTVDSPFSTVLPGGFPPDYLVATIARGELVYVMAFQLNVYSIQCQGALVQFPGKPLNVPVGEPSSIVVDPKGQFAYVAINQELVTCKIGEQGELTPMPGSKIPPGVEYVVLDSAGTFAYVNNFSSNSVSVYRVGAEGSLTPVPGSPFPTGNGPGAVATTPNPRHPSTQR